MASKIVYARLEEQLHARLKAHAESRTSSLSTAVEELVTAGFEAQIDKEPKEVLREKLQVAEADRARIAAQLTMCQANESIALSAKSHAANLEKQVNANRQRMQDMETFLGLRVAKCRHCGRILDLTEFGRKRCPICGHTEMDVLPERQPAPTTLEQLRDGAAVIGTVAIVAALLNALSGEDESGR